MPPAFPPELSDEPTFEEEEVEDEGNFMDDLELSLKDMVEILQRNYFFIKSQHKDLAHSQVMPMAQSLTQDMIDSAEMIRQTEW